MLLVPFAVEEAGEKPGLVTGDEETNGGWSRSEVIYRLKFLREVGSRADGLRHDLTPIHSKKIAWEEM